MPESSEESGSQVLDEYADFLAGDAGEAAKEKAEVAEAWVGFRLAEAAYALPVDAVREVLRVDTITAVPHTPSFVRGVANMRGRVLPVVDLRVRLGFDRTALAEASRILVVSEGSEPVGLLVDAVEQMLQIFPSRIREPPADTPTDQLASIVGMAGVADDVLLLLRTTHLLETPELGD